MIEQEGIFVTAEHRMNVASSKAKRCLVNIS